MKIRNAQKADQILEWV